MVSSMKKAVSFTSGKLGFMTYEGQNGQLLIAYVTPDSQADCKGLAPGDIITGINGKPLEDLMISQLDSETFARVVRQTRSESPDRSITIEVASEINDGPDDIFRVTEENVTLDAGVMYKRDFQVKAGQTLRLRFWTSEEDVDIGFSIEEYGCGTILAPCRGVWTEKNAFGSKIFRLERAGKICLVWDNSHSWVRGKTLSYFCELLPARTPAENGGLLTAERARLQRVVMLLDQKVAKTEALLKAEKDNRAELQARLEQVSTQLQDLSSSDDTIPVKHEEAKGVLCEKNQNVECASQGVLASKGIAQRATNSNDQLLAPV